MLSLAHLRWIQVDAIKIDRSFVETFSDSSSSSIIKAIIGLGTGLNKEVIGEGVETQEQAAFLAEKGCHTGQGFLFGKAMKGSDVPHVATR